MGSNIVEVKKEGILLGIEGVSADFRRFPAQLRRFPAHFRQFAYQFRRFYTFGAHLLCISGLCFTQGQMCFGIFGGLFIFRGRSPFSMISSHLELTSLSRSNGPKYGQFGPNLLLKRSIWGYYRGHPVHKSRTGVSISQENWSPGRWFWSFSAASKPASRGPIVRFRATTGTQTCADRDIFWPIGTHFRL